MRRYGEQVLPGKPYRDRPGAYAIIGNGSGQVLLAATTNEGEDFLLPGGGIDPGEQPLQALHREVLEETGWRIAAPLRLGAYQRYVFMPDYGFWARKICTIYLARAVRPLMDPLEPDHTPIWMDAEEAALCLSVSAEQSYLSGLIESGISF
ncbi:MAG: NUDIX hydrolase [Pseudomonadota bacterium]